MSSSFLSVLIQRQAGKYGDRVALPIPNSINAFETVFTVAANWFQETGIHVSVL